MGTGYTTITSSDVDGGTAVYSIVGGADQALFTIDGGQLVIGDVSMAFCIPTSASGPVTVGIRAEDLRFVHGPEQGMPFRVEYIEELGSQRLIHGMLGDQARAAAPDAHVWLSASAGTGKTHVLTARVFRLAFAGHEPWVVAFGFGNFAHGIGERQGVLEVLEQEDLFQLHDAVANFDVPVRDLLDQYRQFFVADLGGVGTAGFAMGLVQGVHR